MLKRILKSVLYDRNEVSYYPLNDLLKNFFLASFVAITIISLAIIFNVIRAFLADKTEISIRNMMSLDWIWRFKYYLALVFLIGVIYLASSMLLTQFSSDISSGEHAATLTFLILVAYSSIFIPLQIYIYNLWRKEYMPPLSDRFWLYIISITILGIIIVVMTYAAINRLQEICVCAKSLSML